MFLKNLYVDGMMVKVFIISSLYYKIHKCCIYSYCNTSAFKLSVRLDMIKTSRMSRSTKEPFFALYIKLNIATCGTRGTGLNYLVEELEILLLTLTLIITAWANR